LGTDDTSSEEAAGHQGGAGESGTDALVHDVLSFLLGVLVLVLVLGVLVSVSVDIHHERAAESGRSRETHKIRQRLLGPTSTISASPGAPLFTARTASRTVLFVAKRGTVGR